MEHGVKLVCDENALSIVEGLSAKQKMIILIQSE